jgi:hypothetical protein
MMSRSPEGVSIVTVSALDADDVTFEARSPALGLLAAAATLVARRLERPDASEDRAEALH